MSGSLVAIAREPVDLREQAVARMHRALRELVVDGIETSREFHLRVMEDAEFHRHVGHENILGNVEAALRRAEEIWRTAERR